MTNSCAICTGLASIINRVKLFCHGEIFVTLSPNLDGKQEIKLQWPNVTSPPPPPPRSIPGSLPEVCIPHAVV